MHATWLRRCGRLVPVAVVGVFMASAGAARAQAVADAPVKAAAATDIAVVPATDLQWLVDEAVASFKGDNSGENAS